MCLERIIKRHSTNKRIIDGFKIVAFNNVDSKDLYAPLRYDKYKVGWNNRSKSGKDKVPLTTNGYSAVERYQRGFHGFATLNDAKDYAVAMNSYTRRILIPVKFRGVRTVGRQQGSDCIVADSMFIDKKIMQAAIKAWGELYGEDKNPPRFQSSVFVYEPPAPPIKTKPAAKAKARKR